VPFVSSDPHAWIYLIYARLRADTKFGLLSPAHQFDALATAVEKESSAKTASMREWSPDAQVGMLKWLNDVTLAHPNPTNEIELWRVRSIYQSVSMCDCLKGAFPSNATCAGFT
jgi:hypothetical protein